MKVGGHCIIVLHILCHKENAVAGWGFFTLLPLSYSCKFSSADGSPHSFSPKSQGVCQLSFNFQVEIVGLNGGVLKFFPQTPCCSFRKRAARDIFSKRCVPSPGNYRNCRPLVWKAPLVFGFFFFFSQSIYTNTRIRSAQLGLPSTSKFVEVLTFYTRKKSNHIENVIILWTVKFGCQIA